MDEPKLSRVQRLPVKLQFLQYLAVGLSRPAIDRVADQRMTDRRHVDAYLMGSAGLQATLDKCRVLQHLEALPVRNRALATAAGDDGDPLAVVRRPGERCVDYPLARLGNAVHDREIAAVNRMRGELLR